MDVYCSKCGEPTELEEIEYLAEDTGTDFRIMRARWAREGCALLGYPDCSDTDRGTVVSAVYGLLGDDIDDAAVILADAGF